MRAPANGPELFADETVDGRLLGLVAFVLECAVVRRAAASLAANPAG